MKKLEEPSCGGTKCYGTLREAAAQCGCQRLKAIAEVAVREEVGEIIRDEVAGALGAETWSLCFLV